MPEPWRIRAQPIPQAWCHLVALNSTYGVLICRSDRCCYALSPTAVARTSIDVQPYVKHFPFMYEHATVPLPADGLAPQPIVPVVQGLACRGSTFKSTSRPTMRKHANKACDQKRVRVKTYSRPSAYSRGSARGASGTG